MCVHAEVSAVEEGFCAGRVAIAHQFIAGTVLWSGRNLWHLADLQKSSLHLSSPAKCRQKRVQCLGPGGGDGLGLPS